MPWKLRYFIECVRNKSDWMSSIRFIFARRLGVSLLQRLRFIWQIYAISARVDCAHSQREMLEVASATLRVPSGISGVIIEAGCFKGGSTAKLSLVAKLANRRLIAFDSFEGLPQNTESNQRSIYGEVPNFERGKYCGEFEEVLASVTRFGDISRCTLVKGWFEETMAQFSEPVICGYMDVDLTSSTRTCLRYLLPHVQPGSSLYSQDGHLPLIINLLSDEEFWSQELNRSKPWIDGLGLRKLVRIYA